MQAEEACARCCWPWCTDVRVVLVKLADRLHNMRTLYYLSPEKLVSASPRRPWIFYAPIAKPIWEWACIRTRIRKIWRSNIWNRRPITTWKARLWSRTGASEFMKFLTGGAGSSIRKSLAASGKIPAAVEGRIKRLYSMHQKAKRAKTLAGSGVYDLLAVRIITDSGAAVTLPRWA